MGRKFCLGVTSRLPQTPWVLLAGMGSFAGAQDDIEERFFTRAGFGYLPSMLIAIVT
jgi:hypothetical protein